MKIYTPDDCYPITWDDYQAMTTVIANQLKRKNCKFDFIVPIARGGYPLAVSLSHILNIFKIYPVQYHYQFVDKNDKKVYTPIRLLQTIDNINNKNNEYSILITEGNHCTGQTAQDCVNLVKDTFPNSKIFYVSLCRDFSYQASLKKTDFEFFVKLTNDSETLTQTECDKHSITNKFGIFPWETVEGELNDINRTSVY